MDFSLGHVDVCTLTSCRLVLVQSVFDFLVKCLRTDGVLRTKTPIASLTQSVEEDDDE